MLKLRKALAITVVILSVLLGGCGGTKVHQDINYRHNLDCTKDLWVRTTIHIHGWDGMSNECIYLEDVHINYVTNIDSIAELEYRKAEVIKERFDNCDWE